MSKHKVDITGINTSDLKVLKNDEMIELFNKLKLKDNNAREKLIEGNLKLVLSILKSFTNRTDENTSTTTTNARTDTRTNTITEKVGARQDTTESSTSNTFGGHTDATSRNENETYTHKSHMYGNIGVTTSQQMLESEREVAYFNFVSIVAHDIIKLIAICIY